MNSLWLCCVTVFLFFPLLITCVCPVLCSNVKHIHPTTWPKTSTPTPPHFTKMAGPARKGSSLTLSLSSCGQFPPVCCMLQTGITWLASNFSVVGFLCSTTFLLCIHVLLVSISPSLFWWYFLTIFPYFVFLLHSTCPPSLCSVCFGVWWEALFLVAWHCGFHWAV